MLGVFSLMVLAIAANCWAQSAQTSAACETISPEIIDLIVAGVQPIVENNRASKCKFDAIFQRNGASIRQLVYDIGIAGDVEIILDSVKQLSHKFVRDLQHDSDEESNFAVNLARTTLDEAFERLPAAARQNEMVQYFMEQALLVVRESVQLARTQLDALQDELLTDLRFNYAQVRLLHQKAATASPCHAEYYQRQFVDQFTTILELARHTVQSYWDLTAFLIQSASGRVLKLMEAAVKVRYSPALV